MAIIVGIGSSSSQKFQGTYAVAQARVPLVGQSWVSAGVLYTILSAPPDTTKTPAASIAAAEPYWAVAVSGPTTTDQLPEAASPTNKYFTAARTLGTLLAGYAVAATNRAVAVTDSILVAFGVLEKRLVDVETALPLKAPLASPALTGTPTAPTPAAADNSTTLATTAYVTAKVSAGATPIATATTVGTVKPGTNLTVAADGTLNAATQAAPVSSVNTKTGAVVLNTDDVQETATPTNKYFTAARAVAAALTGYVKASAARALVVGDSVLVAFGVLEKRTELLEAASGYTTPVTAYKLDTTVKGYATIDAAFADATVNTFIRLNIGELTMTASNPANGSFPYWLDGSGSTFRMSDGVVLTVPQNNVASLFLTNIFFYYATTAPLANAKIKLSATTAATQAGGYDTQLPVLLNVFTAVAVELSGAAYILDGGYYNSLTGTGTVYLYGSVKVGTVAAGITVVDRRGSTEATGPLTYAASVAADFGAAALQTLTLAGNVAFTSANRAAGKSLAVRLLCDATARTLAFPAGWVFLGAAPTSLAATKTAVLSLTCYGPNDTDVVAMYAAQA